MQTFFQYHVYIEVSSANTSLCGLIFLNIYPSGNVANFKESRSLHSKSYEVTCFKIFPHEEKKQWGSSIILKHLIRLNEVVREDGRVLRHIAGAVCAGKTWRAVPSVWGIPSQECPNNMNISLAHVFPPEMRSGVTCSLFYHFVNMESCITHKYNRVWFT